MKDVEILIIDDDEDDFLIVQSLLEEISRYPIQLEWAPNYGDGERLLSQNRHSICLMDYRLGAEDGIQLLKRAPGLGFTGPIIVLTGLNHRDIDEQALEAGAVDYLVKNNLSAETLARSIRYALGRREMEFERLERLRAEAENRSKSEFLAHLSHELRTPLAAILGFTELLTNEEKNEDRLRNLDIVYRNGKHLLGLLNDILDLSKIEAGKLELDLRPVHTVPFMVDIYSLMYTSATDKNLRFQMKARNSLPKIILTDPTRLRQILLNLIGNAIKFTQQGEINVDIELLMGEKNELIIEVSDSGIGIDAEHLQTIFKPFNQIKNARIQARAGSGLGLTISKQLANHLGGDISVQSEESKGSKFRLSIDPGEIRETEQFNLTARHTSRKFASLPPNQLSGHVLVVDDLRDIRTLVGHFIARCGVEVKFANNGLEAVERLTQSLTEGPRFDLVFMDIHMPVIDGIEAAQQIRERGIQTKLIALTASNMKGDRDNYLSAGFDDCLSKPVDQSQIENILTQYLSTSIVSDSQDALGVAKLECETSADANIHTSSAERRSVLIVEDAKDTLAAMESLLTALDWHPIGAQSGATAVSLAKEHNPSIALVDIGLPDMDGYQLASQLREILVEPAIYIVSGTDFNPKRAKNIVNGHLLKPVDLNQLETILNSHV